MMPSTEAIYKLAAKKLGVAPMLCVVVEDTAIGASAGKAANMKATGAKTWARWLVGGLVKSEPLVGYLVPYVSLCFAGKPRGNQPS